MPEYIDRVPLDQTDNTLLNCETLTMNSSICSGNETCCFEFPKEEADVIFHIKVVLGSIGILLSIFTTGLIVLLKLYKKFVYRLVMYLMAANIMHALCMIIQHIPVEVADNNCIKIKSGEGWTEVCTAVGYLVIVVNWMENFVIIWIMLYLLKLSWQLYHLQSSQQANPNPRLHKSSNIHEIVGVIFLVFSPFLFGWIPFVGGMYGKSGPWCFIKTASDDGCNDKDFQTESFSLMMVMINGPIVATTIFVLISMILMVGLLRKSSVHLHGAVRLRYESSMKHIGFALICPLIYCLFGLFLLFNHVYSYTHNPHNYTLWIIHAVADACLVLIPAIAFLCHPRVWKKVIACRTSQPVSAHTKYSVPPEDDDISEGYTIRPTTIDGLYGSANSDILSLTVRET